MRALTGSCPQDFGASKPTGAELSLLLYAFYGAIEAKLNGSIKDAVGTKMSIVSCKLFERDFVITITGPSNMTAAGKILKYIGKLAAVIPRLKSGYRVLASRLGLRYNDDDYGVAANIITHACKHMQVGIVGIRINDDKVKLANELVATIIGAIPAGATSGAISPGAEDPNPDMYVRGDKLGCMLLQAMLAVKTVQAESVSGGISPALLPRQWPAVQKRLTPHVDGYIESRYMRLGEKLPDAMRIFAARAGYFTPADLRDLGAPTQAKLAGALKRILA